jgi:hypothetical protein
VCVCVCLYIYIYIYIKGNIGNQYRRYWLQRRVDMSYRYEFTRESLIFFLKVLEVSFYIRVVMKEAKMSCLKAWRLLQNPCEPMWYCLPWLYIYISWKSCYQRLKSFSKHTFKEAWEIEKNNTNMYTKEKKLNKIKEECLFVEAL